MNLYLLIFELFLTLLELFLKRQVGGITLESAKKYANTATLKKAFEYSTPFKRILTALGKLPDPPETLGAALEFMKSAKGKRWLAETF